MALRLTLGIPFPSPDLPGRTVLRANDHACAMTKFSGLTGLRDFLPHNAHPPLKESLLNAIELLTFRAFQHRGSTAWTCFTRVIRMTASISSTQTETAIFTLTAIRKLTEEVGRLSSED